MSTTFTAPIVTILSALAAIARTVPGVMHAFSLPPEVMPESDFPCVFFIPGPMTPDWVQPGEDELAIEGYLSRQYTGYLLVSGIGTGITGEMIAKTIPFFDRMVAAYMAYPSLNNTPGVNGVQYQADSGGTGSITINGADYYGFRFTVVVQTRERIAYEE